MSVGKRIYLQRELPDMKLVEEFKNIPASNTADVMGRNSAMNPRIHLVSKPKAQMMAGPAYTVKCRAGRQPGPPRRSELLSGGRCPGGVQRGGQHPRPDG